MKYHKQQSGFTILEVVFTLAILMTLTVFATQMIRSGLDMRENISNQAEVTRRMARAMHSIVNDLRHAFVVNRTDDRLNFVGRRFKTIFQLTRNEGSYDLALTTGSHRPMRANAKESDQTYVKYELRDRPDSEVSDLYRGSTPFIPDNFREEITLSPFVKGIKTLKFQVWNGDRWLDENWDSEKSDYRDKIPHMVMVTIEAWEVEPETNATEDQPTATLNTVVFLERAVEIQEPKEGSKSISWY